MKEHLMWNAREEMELPDSCDHRYASNFWNTEGELITYVPSFQTLQDLLEATGFSKKILLLHKIRKENKQIGYHDKN